MDYQDQEPIYPAPKRSDGAGFSIAGLVLGILATIVAWFYMYNIIAIVMGILGIIFAAVGRKKAKEAGASTGLGTAGLVLSIIGTVLAVVGFFACTICIGCMDAIAKS
ncbi:MAG: hypothetical protein II797_05880 [Clostridia bacterium]|nr:hypothetical protein [Clostridia bacterium]